MIDEVDGAPAQAADAPPPPPPPSAVGAGRAGRRGDALTLASVLLGFLVVPMAMSGTSVALPAIAMDLGGSGATLQWVVTGYFLAATCFMLVAGSLGDLYGRRRVLRAGVVLYAVGTLTAAAAPGLLLLDAARTLAGVGAAGLLACGGAVLASTFTGAQRNRAFGAVGTVVGVGLAFGPTVSGWLVTSWGWRAMFLTFGIAGLAVLAGTVAMRESAADRSPRFDLPGVATLVAGLVGMMYAANQAGDRGWGDATVVVPALVGLLLLVVFVRIERRSAHPVLDLDLLAHRRFLGWLLAALALALGTVGVLVYLPTYLQGAGGMSARSAGLVMLMLTAPVLVVPPVVSRAVNAGVSPRLLVVGAILALALGNAWLAFLHPDIGPGALAGPLLLTGVGNGTAVALIDAQALGLVDDDRIGMASGLLNTMRSGANTVVLALFGAVLATLVAGAIGDQALAGRAALGDLSGGDAGLLDAYTSAWAGALRGVAVLCVLAAAAVFVLTRVARPSDE